MTAVERFAVHGEPAWRHKSDFIINAKLPEDGQFEQLWVRKISDESFELCCIPFFIYDVALGDIVRTRQVDDRQYLFDGVIEPSGHYVFRAHFDEFLHLRDDVFERLAELGAEMEWSSSTLLAIDARDLAHAQKIADFLQARTDLGQLVYETGRIA